MRSGTDDIKTIYSNAKLQEGAKIAELAELWVTAHEAYAKFYALLGLSSRVFWLPRQEIMKGYDKALFQTVIVQLLQKRGFKAEATTAHIDAYSGDGIHVSWID